jgi:hypothetical protein
MVTEDFPTSSISISVSNASREINSVTGASSICNDNGNPDSYNLSLIEPWKAQLHLGTSEALQQKGFWYLMLILRRGVLE